ncbi:hypothetical protein BHM03_00035630 [Ensete ventricosum]|uniref:Uncharacterized protein n=1 Tax=Ensete ventricosum TaxID=4639 RepID=A0A445MJ84_ENSVE|nr:hypothetical protein BHM03_00035630 [Ensete ventricosum]
MRQGVLVPAREDEVSPRSCAGRQGLAFSLRGEKRRRLVLPSPRSLLLSLLVSQRGEKEARRRVRRGRWKDPLVEVDAELVQGDVGGGHKDLLHEGVAALEDNEIEGFGALLIKIGRHLPVLQHLRPLRRPNPKQPNSNSTDTPEAELRSTERNEGAEDEALILLGTEESPK